MQVGNVHWNRNKEKERYFPNFWSRLGLGLDHLFQAFSVLFLPVAWKDGYFQRKTELASVSRVAFAVISDQARATSD